jgi:hypothetical protein
MPTVNLSSFPSNSWSIIHNQDKTIQLALWSIRRCKLVLWFAELGGALMFALVENIPPFDPVMAKGTVLMMMIKMMPNGRMKMWLEGTRKKSNLHQTAELFSNKGCKLYNLLANPSS